jgi:hypothetical protein
VARIDGNAAEGGMNRSQYALSWLPEYYKWQKGDSPADTTRRIDERRSQWYSELSTALGPQLTRAHALRARRGATPRRPAAPAPRRGTRAALSLSTGGTRSIRDAASYHLAPVRLPIRGLLARCKRFLAGAPFRPRARRLVALVRTESRRCSARAAFGMARSAPAGTSVVRVPLSG